MPRDEKGIYRASGEFRQSGIYRRDRARYKTLNANFKRVMRRNVSFHALRHTYAVNSLRAGDDIKTVQEDLGHYDAGFALRTYTHTANRQQAEAADMTGNLMAQSL